MLWLMKYLLHKEVIVRIINYVIRIFLGLYCWSIMASRFTDLPTSDAVVLATAWEVKVHVLRLKFGSFLRLQVIVDLI